MIVHSDERGRVVKAEDSVGAYYYIGDDLGNACVGAFSREEDALEAFEMEDSGNATSDLEMDDFGYRPVACAYCGAMVRPGDSVPKADDEDGWEEAAKGHADDCEWVETRAHRRDGR